MRTLVVIGPNQTAASGVRRWMIVPRGKFVTPCNHSTQGIVFTLATALRGRVNHPRDFASRFKGQEATLAIGRTCNVIDM